MKTTTTTIRGLAIDVLIIETQQQADSGEIIWYVATILVQNRRTGAQRLLRRTPEYPVPGGSLRRRCSSAAFELWKRLQQNEHH